MLSKRERNLLSKTGNDFDFEANEISSVKRRLDLVIAENRKLKTRLTQENVQRDGNTEDSLYQLLQEYMLENNKLKESNR